MSGILSISLSGMRAFQRALDVTSHNIANVNTPGYSRQVVNFTARAGTGTGVGYVGSGTQVSSIERIYDALQIEQLQISTTGYSRFNTMSNLSSRIDVLLADPGTGLSAGLQSYYNAMQDLTNDPSSIPTRQAVIGEAQGLAFRFQSLDGQLDDLEGEVNARLELAVKDINRIATSIAAVNEKIALTRGSSSSPSDLLDERDNLVLQLSAQVSVTTSVQDDGTLSVFIGSGQSLVLGGEARQLGITGAEFDLSRATITYQGATGNTVLDTHSTGGNLGGLLDFRSRILDPARQSLGQTAIAFAATINSQHAAGMDLRGNLGGDLFSVDPPTISTSSNNTGSGTATASISDLAALTGVDYVLEFDGSAYSLTRTDLNTSVTLTGAGTPADPFLGDGISIVVAGAPAAGDRLLIRSSHGAAGSIQSIVTDPQVIAVAAPTRSSASLGNTGNANVSFAAVVDASNPALLTSSVIEFTGPATYSINGAGSFPYVDGSPIVINGSSIEISGQPAVGDQFTVEANYGAFGDNANGLLMANTQSVGILDGGAISINESYSRLVSSVGSTTYQAKAGLEAQGVVLKNAEDAVLSTSAVNLDEEAANLIRYQQAYQAVAQVVAVASTLFDSLLNATRR